jgi:hypothetical protein
MPSSWLISKRDTVRLRKKWVSLRNKPFKGSLSDGNA